MKNKIRLVMAHEIYTLVWRPSFWLVLLGLPLVSFVILGGIGVIKGMQGSGAEEAPFPILGELPETVQEEINPFAEEREVYYAYFDEGGLLKDFPPDFDLEPWVPVSSLENGLDLLRGAAVSKVYDIPADYASSLHVDVYTRSGSDFFPLADFAPLRRAIAYNLIGDPALFEQVDSPILEIHEELTAPPEESTSFEDPFQIFLPYGVMTALFMAIAGTATLMLNSIASEKENRVMEVLVNSMRPTELMVGKIIGLGLVGLLQVIVWGTSAYGALLLSGQAFSLPVEALPDPAIIAWVVVFFLLGYLLYGAVMAGVGALVPNLREASQVTLLVSIPMWVPFVLITALLNAPGGGLAVSLSLFPFTAPLAMILRLTVSHPPLWQPLLAALLMALTIVLVMRLSARLFRAQTLMAGQRFTPAALFRALRDR